MHPPHAMPPGSAGVTSEPFGQLDGQPVLRFTLTGAGGLIVRLLSYGGIVQAIEAPDRDGRPANVTLGFPDLHSYVTLSPFFGAIIGRYANRIAGGRFTLDGQAYSIPINSPPNSLHGGARGFDKHIWQAEELREGDAVGIRLARTSPDGEEGYPGALRVEVSYLLTANNALRIRYRASVDRPTVLNLTNHAYFNLAGEGAGDVYDHVLRLAADRYTPIDAALIPTGAIEPVAGTPLDFTAPIAIGARIRDRHQQLLRAQGYDHNMVVRRADRFDASLVMAARVYEPRSGRVLEVSTTEPGLQFYSGNFLDGTLVGTGGNTYRQGDGFCLETQHFPDSPHRPEFPSTVLRPDQEFDSTTVYTFSTSPHGSR